MSLFGHVCWTITSNQKIQMHCAWFYTNFPVNQTRSKSNPLIFTRIENKSTEFDLCAWFMHSFIFVARAYSKRTETLIFMAILYSLKCTGPPWVVSHMHDHDLQWLPSRPPGADCSSGGNPSDSVFLEDRSLWTHLGLLQTISVNRRCGSLRWEAHSIDSLPSGSTPANYWITAQTRQAAVLQHT